MSHNHACIQGYEMKDSGVGGMVLGEMDVALAVTVAYSAQVEWDALLLPAAATNCRGAASCPLHARWTTSTKPGTTGALGDG